MSANFPPPQQPSGQNPFAPGPAGGNPYGPPPAGNPYGQPQGPYGGPQVAPAFNPNAYPPPAVAQRRDNIGLGIVAGVAVALVAALAYGGLLRALAKSDGTTVEFRYAALAVGALIGVVMGKVGGRTVAMPILAAVLAVLAVMFGEIFGGALIISHYASEQGGSISVATLLFHHFGILFKAWKSDFGAMRVFFLVFAAVAAAGLAKRMGEN
ncbi:hypothetical protein RVR_6295 [Actinacidiphila reveromycinica]|uniref:Uncharacterized protein n=1 Tax=Actinacidiphila reveromycinica TaxID=659352 RepID=A0A7U3UVG1_9ACTN|nr:hypothetical protein [Streptomyces sp. SN-593]BBA99602.1 hypothetical protein RVR_6295 [Streptomyces sp. SN-593]